MAKTTCHTHSLKSHDLTAYSRGEGGGGEEDSVLKRTGVLIVPFRG